MAVRGSFIDRKLPIILWMLTFGVVAFVGYLLDLTWLIAIGVVGILAYVWWGRQNVSMLHLAIDQWDEQEVIPLIHERYHEIHATDRGGHTPLHIAARRNQSAVAEQLIRMGAHVDAKNKKGNTPLHWAVTSKAYNVVAVLVANGADMYSENSSNVTPIESAVLQSDPEMINMLQEGMRAFWRR